MGYEIKTAKRSELSLISDMAAAEGWNPGLSDMQAFNAQDPDGFLIGWLDGKPVSCISVVKYPENSGFLGFYIAIPEIRGTGLGLQIWERGMARLEGYDVGLDGVVDQQDNYRKSGFELAFRNCRYQGLGGGVRPDNVDDIEKADLQDIADFDKRFFGFARPDFLEKWITQPGHLGMTSCQNSKLAGYGIIRECREGYKIGPLFADDADTAENLFAGLKSLVPGSNIYLDIPLQNNNALDLVSRHGMIAVFETARMYKGLAPALPVDNIYGVTSFELG